MMARYDGMYSQEREPQEAEKAHATAGSTLVVKNETLGHESRKAPKMALWYPQKSPSVAVIPPVSPARRPWDRSDD